jgi:hypothetical protein
VTIGDLFDFKDSVRYPVTIYLTDLEYVKKMTKEQARKLYHHWNDVGHSGESKETSDASESDECESD